MASNQPGQESMRAARQLVDDEDIATATHIIDEEYAPLRAERDTLIKHARRIVDAFGCLTLVEVEPYAQRFREARAENERLTMKVEQYVIQLEDKWAAHLEQLESVREKGRELAEALNQITAYAPFGDCKGKAIARAALARYADAPEVE